MKEWMAQKVAWLLPRCVVKWAGYRIGAAATQGTHSAELVPDLKFMDAMQRWEVDA